MGGIEFLQKELKVIYHIPTDLDCAELAGAVWA